MRAARDTLLLLLPLLAACGGDQIELSLYVPPEHEEDIREIRIRALDPPVAAPFTCDDIAFGRVDLSVLPVSVVGEVNLGGADGASLGNLTRERSHVFFAEAFDDDETRLFAGCTSAEALDEKTELSIELEPSVYLTLTEDPVITSVLGPLAPQLEPLVLRVIDAFDEPAREVEAEWVTAGPGGQRFEARGATDLDGEIRIAPGPIASAGPFVIDMRFRWADFNPQRAFGFLMPEPIEERFSGVFDFAAGEELALLLSEAGETVVRFCSGAELSCLDSNAISIPSGPSFGLLVDRAAGGVLVLTESAWYAATRETPTAQPLAASAPVPELPELAVLAGGCPAGDQVLFDYGFDVEPRYQLFDLAATPIAVELPDADTELLAAGCADTVDDEVVRTFVFRSDSDQTFVLATDEEGELIDSEWLVVGDAIAVGVRGEGPLFGTQLDFDDVVISRMELEIEEEGFFLDPIDADHPPGFPIRTAAGDIDGDGGIDVVSILDIGVDEDRFGLWIAIAAESSGARIQGSIELDSLALCSPDDLDLLLLDDGDGKDEIVILDWCGTMLRKIVLPMK